ncbi:Hypothetical predicted protein [Paramuricea clavata]|uniref:Uncharacterized protein n=1 Tax=Paramuricea clavata TaxID=317549 RepID=A0A6S7HK73_PARCT|nr:Hypothetical predicted protein [Paramuricea clavata]
MKRKSLVSADLTNIGICICQCGSDYRTFVTAKLICTKDKEIRNTRQTSLGFKLYKNEQPGGHLEIISFHPVTIKFLAPKFYNEICDLNDIEELSDEHLWQWDSVKDLLLNYSIIEIDDDDIERRFTWLEMTYEGWMMLRLNWSDNPYRFVGRIIRINVTCENSNKRQKKYKTGVMVFKVNGVFAVQDGTIPTSTVAPVVSTTYYLTPAPSTESSVFVYSTTSMIQQ